MIDETSHRNGISRSIILLVSVCSIAPHTALAQTDRPRATVDISAGGTFDSNPFLLQNGGSAGSATITIAPKLVWEDESSTAIIDSSFRLSQYTNRYGGDEAARIGAEARNQLDERTSISVRAGFQSSRSTLQDSFFLDPSDPFGPGYVPEIDLTDITIAGRRVRVNTLDASAGVSHILSPSDTVSLTVDTSYSEFGQGAGADYRTGYGEVQYNRRLTERTSIFATVSAGVADYLGRDAGDSTIITPGFGIEHQLNEQMSLDASVGVSFAAIDRGAGPKRNNTYAAGRISLCNREIRSSFCATASTSAEPTALGGISAVTSVAVKYDLKLSLKDRFSLSGRYGRTDRGSDPLFPAFGGNTEVYGAQAVYTRYLTDRVSFDVMPSFTKINQSMISRESNFSIMTSIRIRLGQLR